MKREIALIAIATLLITIAVSTGMVQANQGQPKLAPGVWYSTEIHRVNSQRTNWDGTETKPDSSMDREFYYQRIGDKLFWVSGRTIGVYTLEEGVWVRPPSTSEFASSSGSGRVSKSVTVQGQAIIFDEDGITWTSPVVDRYRLIETSTPGEYLWEGYEHRTTVGTGPIGKPTRP